MSAGVLSKMAPMRGNTLPRSADRKGDEAHRDHTRTQQAAIMPDGGMEKSIKKLIYISGIVLSINVEIIDLMIPPMQSKRRAASQN